MLANLIQLSDESPYLMPYQDLYGSAIHFQHHHTFPNYELSLSYLSLCERENSFSIHFPSQILQRFSSQKKVNQEECYIPLDSLQPFRACFFGIPNDYPHENRL